jgi:hypothetical protein
MSINICFVVQGPITDQTDSRQRNLKRAEARSHAARHVHRRDRFFQADK